MMEVKPKLWLKPGICNMHISIDYIIYNIQYAMSICIYVYMCIYIYVYIYIYMCIYIYVYII